MHIQVDKSKIKMVMYKEAADKMGEEVVKAMVRAGTISHRRHPGIPASLGIEWPHYLEVAILCVCLSWF